MNKIIVRIFGGLGNQLFSYAATRRLALANGAELVIDDVSGFARDYQFKRNYQLDNFNILCRKATPSERLEPFSLIRRYFKRKINNYFDWDESSYIMQKGLDFEERLIQLRLGRTTYLEGYWQSENYFKDEERIIRQDLQIKPPNDTENLYLAAKIRDSEAVAIHVRFFDNPNESSIYNLDRSYYAEAIAQMEILAPNAHYFVFADRLPDVYKKITLPRDRVTYVSHNQGDAAAYSDLWLMTQCKHFIIANSTFSWWGAWLAEYVDKQVIAPKIEIQSGAACWGFKGLLPEAWRKI